MDCNTFHRLFEQEKDLDEKIMEEWEAHAKSCAKCSKYIHDLEAESLDPRIVWALTETNVTKNGVMPVHDMIRKTWERAGCPKAPKWMVEEAYRLRSQKQNSEGT